MRLTVPATKRLSDTRRYLLELLFDIVVPDDTWKETRLCDEADQRSWFNTSTCILLAEHRMRRCWPIVRELLEYCKGECLPCYLDERNEFGVLIYTYDSISNSASTCYFFSLLAFQHRTRLQYRDSQDGHELVNTNI